MDSDENKTLEQLYSEGKIDRDKLRSIVFLAQTGIFLSSSPADALFIDKQIKRMENGLDVTDRPIL